MIIAVLNPKGGSGKTTLSTHLARAYHDQGRRVLLVDSDPQGSARDWHAACVDNPLPLVAIDRANTLHSLPRIAADYELVLVDGAAKLEDMLAGAIRVADFALIPLQPSPYDVWAVEDLVELIKARQQVTDGRPGAAFVVARAIQRTRLGAEVYEALGAHGLPVLKTATVQRQVYPQSASRGLTVFDVAHPQAMAETRAVADELLEHLEVANA